MSNDIELRIAHSQSSKDKVWVTLLLPDGQEFAVGFDENNCNNILQVGEAYWEDMSKEERAEPLIAEAQAVLALACYYPVQFVPEPESRELITFLEDLPSKFIAPKHVEKVFKAHVNVTRWQMYEHISLEEEQAPSKGSHSRHAKAPAATSTRTSAKPTQGATPGGRSSSRHAEDYDDDEEASDEDESYDSEDDVDAAHEYSDSDMDEDEEDQYDDSDEGSYDE